jgi:hypothetical protein
MFDLDALWAWRGPNVDKVNDFKMPDLPQDVAVL